MRAFSKRLLAVLAALQAALFFYYLQVNLVLQPYWDLYSHVTRYLRYRQDGGFWEYLWDPHVQHRQIWMRLLTAFDIEVFAGVGYPFVVAAVICQVITAWLLWHEVRRDSPRELSLPAACLVVMLTLTSVSAVACATPINTVYAQTLMFSVMAIVLFAAGENAWRWVGMLAAVAAVFGNTMALVLWPILAWLAWQDGEGLWRPAAVLAVGAVFSAVHIVGLPLIDQARAQPAVPADRLEFMITYLGLPWTRAATLKVAGQAVGALLLAVGVAAVARLAVRQRLPRSQRVALALILFSLGSALLAAAGRVTGGSDAVVAIRYTVLLIPLHAGLLMLALPFLAGRPHVTGRMLVIAAVVLLVQQVGAGEAARGVTAAMRETVARFERGETDPGMLRVVFDDLEEARAQLNAIQRAGLYQNVR